MKEREERLHSLGQRCRDVEMRCIEVGSGWGQAAGMPGQGGGVVWRKYYAMM